MNNDKYNYYTQIAIFTKRINGFIITQEWKQPISNEMRKHLLGIRQSLFENRMYLQNSEVEAIKYYTNNWAKAYIKWFNHNKIHNSKKEEIQFRQKININVQELFHLLLEYGLIDSSVAFGNKLVSIEEEDPKVNEDIKPNILFKDGYTKEQIQSFIDKALELKKFVRKDEEYKITYLHQIVAYVTDNFTELSCNPDNKHHVKMAFKFPESYYSMGKDESRKKTSYNTNSKFYKNLEFLKKEIKDNLSSTKTVIR